MTALEERLADVVARLGADPRRFTTAGGRLGLDGSPIAAIDGIHPDWLLEAAVLRSLAPRHILFLCVANSARSQLAEGIGRSLAPEGVRVSSAGSEPTSIRQEAVEALRELKIDVGGLYSKGMDEIERPVDAVITLCAEEVCPVWLERAWRLHWALPDPAAVDGPGRMNAFRQVRDELMRRLVIVFG